MSKELEVVKKEGTKVVTDEFEGFGIGSKVGSSLDLSKFKTVLLRQKDKLQMFKCVLKDGSIFWFGYDTKLDDFTGTVFYYYQIGTSLKIKTTKTLDTIKETDSKFKTVVTSKDCSELRKLGKEQSKSKPGDYVIKF